MKHLTLAAAAAVVLGSSLPALAQTTVVRGEDKVVVKHRTIVDFTTVNVLGAIEKPEMEWINARHKAGFPSLISLRKNFTPELSKSVERL